MGSANLAGARPAARPVTTILLQPGGLRGKKSNDRDNNFLVIFSSSKAYRTIKSREGMLATIHDDTWNVLGMQPQIRKDGIIQVSPRWWP